VLRQYILCLDHLGVHGKCNAVESSRKTLTGAVAIDEELLHINLSLNHGFRYKGLQIAIDPIEEIVHI
jgi:hypothetical protein